MATACSTGVQANHENAAGTVTTSLSASASSDCGGFPKLDVETPPGVCVGVAASGFKKLRGIGEVAGGDLVVADTGDLTERDGSVWRLHRARGAAFERRLLLDGLDRPASIAVGRDGRVYVGEASSVVRLDPDSPVASPEVVVAGLPSAPRPPDPSEDHFYKAIVFGAHDPASLYVTVGSGSNVCEQADGSFPVPCPELSAGPQARAEVRRYDLWRGTYEVVATGLRNPFALAVHADSGLVLAADNGRDHIDAVDPALTPIEGELPHEALDILANPRDEGFEAPARRVQRFGWPYCYDDARNNPEYPAVNCRRFARPLMLLPAHAAPLGMAYYGGRMFPPVYRGGLLVTYHGYRAHGHRLVFLPADLRGVPTGAPLDVVRDWNGTSTQPRGEPLAVFVASDGSIYVTDDDNGDLLRLVYDAAGGDGTPLPPLPSE